MKTIEINRIEDVRVGDDITLTRDGLTVAGRVRPEGTDVDHEDWHVYFPGIGTLYGRYGWTLVSATREVPDDTAAAVIAAAMVWYQAVEPYDESSPDYDDAFHALRDAVRAHRAALGGAS